MHVTHLALFQALLALAACSSCARKPAPSPAEGLRPRYGAVMAEVGRRWELAGRAAAANRFELASFELGELEEFFADDLARADPPKEGPAAHLPSLASAWVKTHPPALKQAAAKHDAAAFAVEFERASGTCNACHVASEHGYLEISPALGQSVPSLDPKP